MLLVLVASQVPMRRKLATTGLIAAVLAMTYAGLWAVSQTSPALQVRAEGVLNPLGDESVQLRLDTWSAALDDAAHKPLGQGVGTVGAASADKVLDARTTDNTFLKVLIDQGVQGFVLFLVGVLGAVAVLARRLRGVPSVETRSVGLAALAGFVGFLGICLAGEPVEQPGKVIAWALLGIAAAYAFAGSSQPRGTAA
jgi:O-antigen ligase